jgi:hypothetical protein
MDSGLNPVDEGEDEEFEATLLPVQPGTMQDGRPVTIVAEGVE